MSNIDREFPATESSFVPRQVAEAKYKTTGSLSQSGPQQIAHAAVAYLAPITPSSRVHDNGCGDGNATRELLSVTARDSWPSRIDATDVEGVEAALERFERDAVTNGWPVHFALAPAQDLHNAFPSDGVFTHSIANCVIYRLPDAAAAAAVREVYRTLAPGGTAVISGFGATVHRPALQAAHEATRPSHAGPLLGGASRWANGGEPMRTILHAAGFRSIELVDTSSVSLVDDLANWESAMWAVLGRPEAGWLQTDEDRWDEALSVFRKALRVQPGFRLLDGSTGNRAEMTHGAWIAIAKK